MIFLSSLTVKTNGCKKGFHSDVIKKKRREIIFGLLNIWILFVIWLRKKQQHLTPPTIYFLHIIVALTF